MKKLLLAAMLALPLQGAEKMDVLFIAVDDLNDWVGCLGGNPQSKTPHMDALAAESMLFANAHCQAPICNPSRASLLMGKYPHNTGIYYLAPKLRDHAVTEKAVTLPQHFARNGYRSVGAGKIFHGADKGEFQEYAGSFGGFGPRPAKPISDGKSHPLWDWGAYPDKDEEMPDHKIATWVGEQLKTREEPTFLACGFYRPHVPMFAPKKWFDLHPLAEVVLPEVPEDDYDDIPAYGRDISWSVVAPRHARMVKRGEWGHAVQSYLASVSFVDAQVGRVMAALESSGRKDRTIVVLWSDHGFHLGTKECWGKRSLWEDSTKVALMIRVPGMKAGVCRKPVGLIDLFPTLVDLCGLETVTDLDGMSLRPLLENPAAEWKRPALTTFGRGNHAVRSEDWRYIVYADGTEELYDHRVDPEEFINLAGKPEHAGVVARHRSWLPQVNQEMAPGSRHADARPGSAAEIPADRR